MAEGLRRRGRRRTRVGTVAALAVAIAATAGCSVSIDGGSSEEKSPDTPASENTTSPQAPPSASPRPSSAGGEAQTVALPAGQEEEVKFGTETILYRVNTATLGPMPGAPDRRKLSLNVRATNQGSAPINLWDRSFRMDVDGVPRAPLDPLNKLVDAGAAQGGTVAFNLPTTQRKAVLEIRAEPDEPDVAKIRFDLTAAQP